MATATAVEPTVARPAADDDYDHFEETGGVRVELPPMSAYATFVANVLAALLNNYGIQHGGGRAFNEMLFRLPGNGGRNRRRHLPYCDGRGPRLSRQGRGHRYRPVGRIR